MTASPPSLSFGGFIAPELFPEPSNTSSVIEPRRPRPPLLSSSQDAPGCSPSRSHTHRPAFLSCRNLIIWLVTCPACCLVSSFAYLCIPRTSHTGGAP